MLGLSLPASDYAEDNADASFAETEEPETPAIASEAQGAVEAGEGWGAPPMFGNFTPEQSGEDNYSQSEADSPEVADDAPTTGSEATGPGSVPSPDPAAMSAGEPSPITGN